MLINFNNIILFYNSPSELHCIMILLQHLRSVQIILLDFLMDIVDNRMENIKWNKLLLQLLLMVEEGKYILEQLMGELQHINLIMEQR